MEEETNQKTILESVADLADFCNAIAELCVGHRKILADGHFDVNLADSMAASLHAQLLGLVHRFEEEPEMQFIEFLVGNDEDEEDD